MIDNRASKMVKYAEEKRGSRGNFMSKRLKMVVRAIAILLTVTMLSQTTPLGEVERLLFPSLMKPSTAAHCVSVRLLG
jgi:hypothetical protein